MNWIQYCCQSVIYYKYTFHSCVLHELPELEHRIVS